MPASHPHRTHHHRHVALATRVVAAVASAAHRGWTPDDLRHVLGPGVDHLLFRAHHRVATAAPPVRQAWRRQCHPAEPGDRPLAELEGWLDTLERLPALPDQAILTDLHQLQAREEEPAGLSEEQRRARHRITGLLRKAESTTFDAEAEALVAKAQQLRQRHRIEAVLDPRVSQTTSAGPSARRVRFSAPWVRHQYLLLTQVAVANSCTAVLLSRHGIATVIGESDDVQHTTDLFASLNRQCAHFMRTSAGAAEAARAGQTAAYRRAFLLSYASRIGTLLRKAGEEASDRGGTGGADDPGTGDVGRALPVLAARAEVAEERTRQLFPALRGMSFSSRHHQGHRDGRTAAGRSHLRGDRSALGHSA